MKKITISSKNQNLWGGKVNLPVDGEVDISKDGKLSVSEQCAAFLAEHPNYDVPNVDSKVLKSAKAGESTKIEEELQKEQILQQKKQQLKTELSAKNLQELKEIASLTETDIAWEGFAKPKLIEFLLEQAEFEDED